MKEPKEPPYSCPHIDAALDELEMARRIHHSLREWGAWWKDRCEEIERDYSKQVNSLEDDVRKLEDIVESLKCELTCRAEKGC